MSGRLRRTRMFGMVAAGMLSVLAATSQRGAAQGGAGSYEMLAALTVSDEAAYEEYRRAMMPILSRYGGGFGYDFAVAKVLKTAADAEINRVFTIYFRDKAARDAFFADPEYRVAKERFFDKSVKRTTIISEYQR